LVVDSLLSHKAQTHFSYIFFFILHTSWWCYLISLGWHSMVYHLKGLVAFGFFS
jgi:hypothetical protein